MDVGVAILNHCVMTPKTGRDSKSGAVPLTSNPSCSMGANFPTRLHSRDVAYPNFASDTEFDTATLCGAIVSGPYAAPQNGPVEEGTDLYENDRRRWQASETAIDYTSSLVCTMMAYASTPDELLEGCPARTAFTGRT